MSKFVKHRKQQLDEEEAASASRRLAELCAAWRNRPATRRNMLDTVPGLVAVLGVTRHVFTEAEDRYYSEAQAGGWLWATHAPPA